MSNRRKNTETVSVALLAKGIVSAAFVVVAGLSYVYFKNQQHLTGGAITELESQLNKLRSQNQDVRARISVLSSRAVLETHLQSGFIKMIPITNDDIVRLRPAAGADELRPVSNSRISP